MMYSIIVLITIGQRHSKFQCLSHVSIGACPMRPVNVSSTGVALLTQHGKAIIKFHCTVVLLSCDTQQF